MKKIYLVLMLAVAAILLNGCTSKSSSDLEKSPCACLKIKQFEG